MTDSISRWAYRRSVELRRDAEFIGDTFARYIEAHEPPPVDPLVDALAGDVFEPVEFARNLTKKLAQRGFEIVERAK